MVYAPKNMAVCKHRLELYDYLKWTDVDMFGAKKIDMVDSVSFGVSSAPEFGGGVCC